MVCHNEVFHPSEAAFYLPHCAPEHSLRSKTLRDANPRKFIQELLEETASNANSTCTHICYKLLVNYPQLDRGLLATMQHKPRVLILDRADRLALFASIQIAKETGIWMSNIKPDSQKRILFESDKYESVCQALEENFKRVEHAIKDHELPVLRIEYEQLMQVNTISAILRFFELPKMPLVTNTARLNTANVLDRFINPGDVEHYLEKRNG